MRSILQDKNWYASATPYINSHCIINTLGINAFETMCNIIEVSKELVTKNDEYACGAQYILKQITASFWKKIEEDCEKIYSYLLTQIHNSYPFTDSTTLPEFQIWCTDMLAIWWNTLKFNIALKPSEKLKFCWIDSPIEEWEKCSILHYTGKMNMKGLDKKYFYKTDYVYHEPFYDCFSFLDKTTCSSIVVDFIKGYQNELKKNRISLLNVLLIVLLNDSNRQSVVQALSTVKYFSKYFSINIHLIEIGNIPHVDRKLLCEDVGYSFIKKSNYSIFTRNQLIEELIDTSSFSYVGICDSNIIVPIKQVDKCITLLKLNIYSAIIPYNKPIANMDILTSCIFQKIIDDKLLLENLGKTDIRTSNGNINAYFFKKEGYKKMKHFFMEDTITKKSISQNQIKKTVYSIDGYIFKLFLPNLKV